MRQTLPIALSATLLALAAAAPAEAKCTRLAFSVNDYGKDGPTKDAKSLLDSYISKWTAERGIKSYRAGKKDVNCELYLNLIVFDEHTCRAEATVCWDEKNVGPVPKQAKSLPDGTDPAAAAATEKPKAKTKAKAAVPAQVTTGTLPVATPAAVPAAAVPATTAPPAAPPAAIPAPATPPPAAPAAQPAPTTIPPVVPPAASPPKAGGAG